MIRNFVLRYIMRNMSHNDTATRDAIFKAINDGMALQFYEDNAYTRLNFTVLQLVNNGSDFHPHSYSDIDKIFYPDVEALANNAASAVRESCENDPKQVWVTESIFGTETSD